MPLSTGTKCVKPVDFVLFIIECVASSGLHFKRWWFGGLGRFGQLCVTVRFGDIVRLSLAMKLRRVVASEKAPHQKCVSMGHWWAEFELSVAGQSVVVAVNRQLSYHSHWDWTNSRWPPAASLDMGERKVYGFVPVSRFSSLMHKFALNDFGGNKVMLNFLFSFKSENLSNHCSRTRNLFGDFWYLFLVILIYLYKSHVYNPQGRPLHKSLCLTHLRSYVTSSNTINYTYVIHPPLEHVLEQETLSSFDAPESHLESYMICRLLAGSTCITLVSALDWK